MLKQSVRVTITMMTERAYLHTAILYDKGSDFVSQLIKEIAGVLGSTLQYATTNHAQTIGTLEQTNASLKKAPRLKQAIEDQCGTSMSTLKS